LETLAPVATGALKVAVKELIELVVTDIPFGLPISEKLPELSLTTISVADVSKSASGVLLDGP
jgi:hypothetical protein